MADRSIYCEKCHTALGTIRDARLRKDIIYLCHGCYPRPVKTPDIFNELFSGFKKQQPV